MRIIKLQKSFEIIGLFTIYAFLFSSAFILKDSPAALVSAFFGITYTFLAGKGSPICYLFGVTGSGFYSWLAFHNALWGNLALYAGYYIPMQILGFFKWNSHLKKDKNEIVKIHLKTKERIVLTLITLLLTVAAILILNALNDKNPVIDGITAVFSITGMYLTVRRAIEQWIVWMIVNGLSAVMWASIAINGGKVFSTVIMWSVYFVLAIYFYFCWKKEIDEIMRVD